MISLNDGVYNNLFQIVENFGNISNKYGLTKRDIERIINTKTGADAYKVGKLLNIYNDYYSTNLLMEDIFDISYIKNLHQYKNDVNINYGNESQGTFLDKFFITRFISKVYNKIMNNGKLEALTKDKKILLMIIIAFILFNIIAFTLFYNLVSDNNKSGIQLNREEQFIK